MTQKKCVQILFELVFGIRSGSSTASSLQKQTENSEVPISRVRLERYLLELLHFLFGIRYVLIKWRWMFDQYSRVYLL